jgi:hypothetical protein
LIFIHHFSTKSSFNHQVHFCLSAFDYSQIEMQEQKKLNVDKADQELLIDYLLTLS